MNTAKEQLNTFSLNHYEITLRAAQIALDSTERLIRFNLDISKQTLQENSEFARELSGTSDPQSIAANFNKMAGLAAEKAVENARSFYEIISQTQGAMTKLVEDNIGNFNKGLISSIETLAKNAPAGSDAAVNAVKTSIAATAAAVNSVTQSAQQVVHLADSNIKTAGSATADAVKNANAKRSNA
ncbi:phasin family protein [Craterilacuibacter sinensis]|uniref:TIGR01841 family phasin n=1 Tax=Craterilacuibacter sinensis TaxID=2686017 RepID=A0A845BND4_9NEIS|nr:phasin family protein [Craterilacuibacter sinensis]MXR36774.1 TIGR01841 family phasin [Craterilacuibacter sinensis]RQW29246.1 phasin family protein [Rhodobacteraceae bacterium CH30]